MNLHPLFALLLCGASFFSLKAQSIFDLLSNQELLEITMETRLQDLTDPKKNVDYLPAVFSFKDQAGIVQTFDIGVKARGKYRRMVCDFPPLKVKFEKEDLREKDLLPFHKLKLVTHCLDQEQSSADNVLSEYLAYKLYNRLTDQSYRTQLVRITYVDAEKKKRPETRWAFVLEPTAQLEDRIGGKDCEDCYGFSKTHLVAENDQLLHLFQYMIGNEDWSIPKLRNVKLFLVPGQEKMLAVPYDFDFAGLVDAGYAVPSPDLGLVDIRQRAYLDAVPSKGELALCFQRFEAARMDMEALIADFPWLRESEKKRMLSYMDKFFERDFHRLYKEAPEGDATPAVQPSAAFSTSGQ